MKTNPNAPITNPTDLSAEQQAVLAQAHAAYEGRGHFLPRTEPAATTARSLTALGLLVRFGKRNFSITRDGLQIAMRLSNHDWNISRNASELAALLPEMLALIGKLDISSSAGLKLEAKANRLRQILSGNY